MRLSDYLRPEYVAIGLEADSKEDLLEKMVDLAGKNPAVQDKSKVRSAIFEREKIMSTGVGKGFAIPHGKTDAVDDIVLSFAVTDGPVDYASMDNEPVRLVLLLVSRDNLVGQRLKLLSRASKVMNNDDAREDLLKAASVQDVLAIFQREEDRMGD
ncbi:MAG TPA: PTS sugar transporter subunit IIA [Candidatus Kapabacteria bacterium]|jgi:mannitol/fructose-specific phosphotransferase system IIA component (Ntr-type)|nr:PTS sugar transporter subunit IIA [Candidatus Kapabacteria bacterium]